MLSSQQQSSRLLVFSDCHIVGRRLFPSPACSTLKRVGIFARAPAVSYLQASASASAEKVAPAAADKVIILKMPLPSAMRCAKLYESVVAAADHGYFALAIPGGSI
jgi:hypothetical protein